MSCTQPQPPADPNTLATYDGGIITVQDLRDYIATLPSSERMPALGSEPMAWLDRQVSQLFSQRILLTKDELLFLRTDHGFQTQLQRAVDQRLTKEYLIRNQPNLQPDPADIEALASKSGSPKPRVGVYTLFLKVPKTATQTGRQEIRDRLEGLRRGLLSGTSFEELARSHSHSETAAQGGWTGFLDELEISSELRALLKTLPLKKPSEIIESSEGFHVFMTRTVRDSSAVQTRMKAERQLRDQLLTAWLKQEVHALASKRQIAIPSWPLTDRSPNRVLVQLGDRSLLSKDIPLRYEQPARQERLYYQWISTVLFAQELRERRPEKAAALRARTQEDLQFRVLLKNALLASLEDLPEDEILAFVTDERDDFVENEQIAVSLFSWAAPPNKRKDALDLAHAFIQTLQTGTATGAETEAAERLPLTDVRQLKSHRPAIFKSLPSQLEQGACSQPLLLDEQVVVIRVDQFIPGQIPALPGIRKRVLAHYLQKRGPQVTLRWMKQLKDAKAFRIHDQEAEQFLAALESSKGVNRAIP